MTALAPGFLDLIKQRIIPLGEFTPISIIKSLLKCIP
jgi:hypothetical protein